MTTATINGKRAPRAPRGQPGSPLHYNPNIDWYFNESRGEQGEKGQSIDPSGGGGGGTISNNWPMIERLHGCMSAVKRWRKINEIMQTLPVEVFVRLRERYRITERSHVEVMGLRAAMGDLATLAWHLCEDKDGMRLKLSSGKKSRDSDVSKLRRLAEATNREIHIVFLEAERDLVMRWVEGG
jgi:hypothetical protein